MRGGGVAVLPNNAPLQVRICGSTQVNGGPVDLAAPGPVPGGGWPLTMNDARQLNDGLVGPAPVVGDNNYTLYQADGKLYAVHSTKLPVAGLQHVQVHI